MRVPRAFQGARRVRHPRYRNDATGASAYPTQTLLQVVLFAYARGIVSSRSIARACEEHITFIALCGDTRPHFTTIAHFVRTRGADLTPIFAVVLAVCDRQGLIGRETFAIDGVKLPSNDSKQRSGTRADFERQATTLESSATAMRERHRANDAADVEPTRTTKAQQRRERPPRNQARGSPRIRRIDGARRAPCVAASLRSSGRKPSARSYDVMIAATALANALPVYTCNPDDCHGIDGLDVVTVPVPTR